MSAAEPIEGDGKDGFRHGLNGYKNHGCRGPICQRAHALAQATSRAGRYAYTEAYGLPDEVPHNDNAYKNWGCRCPVCTADHTAVCRAWRNGIPKSGLVKD